MSLVHVGAMPSSGSQLDDSNYVNKTKTGDSEATYVLSEALSYPYHWRSQYMVQNSRRIRSLTLT